MLWPSLSSSLFTSTIIEYSVLSLHTKNQTIFPSSLGLVTCICIEEKQDGYTVIQVYKVYSQAMLGSPDTWIPRYMGNGDARSRF